MNTVQPTPDKVRPKPVIHHSVLIIHPDAAGISLEEGHRPGSHTLTLTPNCSVYISLGSEHADREADAKAMDRLAELATEAAAKLRAPLPSEQSAGGA